MIKKITAWMLLIFLFFIITACSWNENNNLSPVNENDSNETNNANSEPVSKPSEDISYKFPGVFLQKGDEGEDVKQLQKGLNAIGYSINKTAIFDKMTIWALTDFQWQRKGLNVTGIYDETTKNNLDAFFQSDKSIEPGFKLPPPKHPEKWMPVIENPYEVLALINKTHALPSDYLPHDLVIPNVRFPFTEDLPKKQMRKVAAEALEDMFNAADEAGLDLFAQSGYRSYQRQDAIFASNVKQHGEEAANNFSARPGESEHQSGLTMDVTSPDVDFKLVIEFGNTKEGEWIKQHAHEFGFIIRYPEGKEEITQYQYEPWHLRFVGKKAAKEIMEKQVTLEEYLDVVN
ncbi:D-alanyl-D-alanine carboxypeptidase family protein [Virgibacillus sp. W0181]|uniref:D-alanyl-D-alanine carboxypeptidase family protein n=1 Tax=Virgibacillus sp. W0181 TaxID=3391581 RepID=UPI003F48E40A